MAEQTEQGQRPAPESAGDSAKNLTPVKNNYETRIVEHGAENPSTLIANPKNWRLHPPAQEAAMRDALDEIGWVQEVIVNKRTGRLVDGHMRVAMAVKKGAQTVPVSYVDLTEEEEEKVLATLDPLAAMASIDKEALANLKSGIDSDRAALSALLEADMASKEDYERPEYEIGYELLESHNYIVLYFDNDLDWQVAREKLDIKTVKTEYSTDTYVRTGLGRVLNGRDVLARLRNNPL